MIFLSDSNLRHGTYSAPDAGVVGILVYSIFAMLVSLPQVIITNRLVFLFGSFDFNSPTIIGS
jgi:hypothetical protein